VSACEVEGDQTGARWTYELTRELPFGGAGHRYQGTGLAGERVLLHFLASDLRPEEIERAKKGLAIASLPVIAAHPHIRRVLDVSELPGHGLWVVYEWAERSLQDLMNGLLPTDEPEPALAATIEQAVGSALETLHGLGFVHCDVAPNNILEVAGVWKLADLEGCLKKGEPVKRHAPYPYASPEAMASEGAVSSMDWYGLQRVAGALRRESLAR
jgi:serine/threonine protein kinase